MEFACFLFVCCFFFCFCFFVVFFGFFFAKKVGNSFTTPPLFKESVFSYSSDLAPCDFFLFSETEIRVCVTFKPVLGGICNLANNSAV